MNTQRTRRLLLVAFALSLLIHALFAASVHWRNTTVEDTVERVSIMHRLRIVKVAPPPRTPAPPRPRTAPSSVPTSRSSRTGTRGTEVAAAQATSAPTQAPTPAPSATPNCLNQDTTAAMLSSPPPIDIAPNARGEATNGTTHVRVDLDTKGTITGATVTLSSGNSGLDLVAVTMARGAQYSPATHACKAIAGTYDFTAKFVAW